MSRLREIERVMNENNANLRYRASIGIVPSRFNFTPVRAGGGRVVAGARFDW